MKHGACKTWITTGLMASVLGFGSAYAGSEQGTTNRPDNPHHAHKDQDKHQGKASQSGQLGKQDLDAAGMSSASGNIILVGDLVETRDVQLKDSSLGSHRLLKVKPNGGSGPDSVIVNIGRRDAASTLNLTKGDRVIAVGKPGRINDRPVLFARSIGELHPVGDVGEVATQTSQPRQSNPQPRQDNPDRGAAAAVGNEATRPDPLATGRTNPAPDPERLGQSVTPSASDGLSNTNPDGAGPSRADVNVPDTRSSEDSDNVRTDRYGAYDREFVWYTDDSWYDDNRPSGENVAWSEEGWQTPQWDVWGFEDRGE